MQKAVLSIDCGTQSLRAIIFSEKGELLAAEKVVYEPYYTELPGWAEQDALVYWNALTRACRNLKENNNELFRAISGVGVTTLRDSMINVDINGNPLRPAMIWLDQRKAEPVFRPKIFLRLFLKLTGIYETIKKAQQQGKCNWIRKNEPEIWDKTHKFLQVSGFLNYKLTGVFNDSVASQIGHIPFDYKKQKWGNRAKLFAFTSKLYPVEKNKLSQLILPGELIGNISNNASEETGLRRGLPVVACGSDKGCETIGMGVVKGCMASLSFGTTATIQTTTKKYIEPIKFMPSYPAVLTGHFNPEVEIFRGFWMITWFKNEFAHREVEDALRRGIAVEEVLDDLLLQSPPGAMGLLVQPYWSPGLKQPKAKGAMIGFGDVHKKPHIYRAVIEGLIFALLDGKEKIEKSSKTKICRVAVSGGASKSDEICQIAADIFNLPLVRGKTTETSALGAALVTAKGVGIYSSLSDSIKNMVQIDKEFLPNPDNVKIYNQLYKKIYKKMYRRLSPLYSDIKKITGYPE